MLHTDHYKMIQKEAQFAAEGAEDRGNHWVWHQDYGYWYNNNALFPNMGSCMVAVDAASEDNGALQVMAGSHQLGRLEHGAVSDGLMGLHDDEEELSRPGKDGLASLASAKQHGADPERVELAEASGCRRLHCIVEPGDAIVSASRPPRFLAQA